MTKVFHKRLVQASKQMEMPAATLARKLMEMGVEALYQFNFPRLRDLKIESRTSAERSPQSPLPKVG